MSTETMSPTSPVQELLKKAAKKTTPTKARAGYLWDGPPDQPAKVLQQIRVLNEAEAEANIGKAELRSLIEPWYANEVRRAGYQATIRCICGVRDDGTTDELRISVQHRYSKIPLDRESAMRCICGDHFESFFKKQAGLKVRKEVAEDPEKLTEVVRCMIEGDPLLTENFGQWFEHEEYWYPNRVFTERRWIDLSDEANKQLEAQGVRQVLSFADSSKGE